MKNTTTNINSLVAAISTRGTSFTTSTGMMMGRMSMA
ncbi:hypothetical protein SAMN05444380_11721 [Thermophagus xiamenensis]|uniref:Uncharacterized protein n=1 Tax=Thermophagus xiamenensis TaxID=385682 RepID=A0A1I2CVN0_9BACT|nr:hypothetical protein SAMN05444380_11721 [Thermophagus xiamenensis]